MLKHCFVFHSKPCAEKSQGIDKDNGKRLFAAKTRRVWNIESLIETLLPRSAIYWGYISHSRLSYFTPPVKIFNAKFALRRRKFKFLCKKFLWKQFMCPSQCLRKMNPDKMISRSKRDFFMEKREGSYKFKAKSDLAKPELHLKCCIYCGVLGWGS